MDKRKNFILILSILLVLIVVFIYRLHAMKNTAVTTAMPNMSHIVNTPIEAILKDLSSCDRIEISYEAKTKREAQQKIQIDDKTKINNFAELLKTETFKETDVNAVDGPYFMAVKIYTANKDVAEFYMINNLLEINDNSGHMTYACVDNNIAFYCQRELGLYDK